MNLCQCGCGEKIPSIRTDGKPQFFVKGHNWRNKERPTHKKEKPQQSAAHEYARRKVKQRSYCELNHIGGCGGPLDVAHVDGNMHNNEIDNLKTLCRSHHFLLDKGRINILNPIMPSFYVDKGGKRRYAAQN